MIDRTSSLAIPDGPSTGLASIDAQSAAALFAAATVGFGTNLAIQLVNLGLQARGAGPGLIGLSTMMQALGIVLAALLAPRAMRFLGLRWTMISGAALAAVTMMSFAHVTGFFALTAMRIVYAIGLALVFSCAEYVVLSRTTDQGRGQAAGLYTTVVGIGMALGPIWIAVVGEAGPVAYYSGAWLCLTCIPVARALESVRVPVRDRHAPRSSYFKLAPVGFFAAFVFGFIDNGPVSLLPICGVLNGWTSTHSVLLVTLVTVGAIAFQWPVGWAVDRFGSPLIVRVGVLMSVLVVLGLPHIWGSPILVITAVIALGVVMEGFYTVGLADIGKQVPAAHLAGANAFFVAMCGAGEIVGPAVTGFALEYFS